MVQCQCQQRGPAFDVYLKLGITLYERGAGATSISVLEHIQVVVNKLDRWRFFIYIFHLLIFFETFELLLDECFHCNATPRHLHAATRHHRHRRRHHHHNHNQSVNDSHTAQWHCLIDFKYCERVGKKMVVETEGGHRNIGVAVGVQLAL